MWGVPSYTQVQHLAQWCTRLLTLSAAPPVVQLGNMTVFYKQRDNLYFPVSAYVLPTSALRVPYSVVVRLHVGHHCVLGRGPGPVSRQVSKQMYQSIQLPTARMQACSTM